MRVCKHFKEASRLIWGKIEKSKNYGIKIQEETITEEILLYLKDNLGDTVKIKTFTKNVEGQNGADWEWFIKRNNKWIGFRVQAKILNYENYKYDSLFKKPDSGKDYQIVNLIREAFKKELVPIYSFYNYVEDFSQYININKKEQSIEHFPVDFELIGWTYAEAIWLLLLKDNNVNDFNSSNLMTVNNLISNLICSKEDFDGWLKNINYLINPPHPILPNTNFISKALIGNGITTIPTFRLKDINELPGYVNDVYLNKPLDANKYTDIKDLTHVLIMDLDATFNSGQQNDVKQKNIDDKKDTI